MCPNGHSFFKFFKSPKRFIGFQYCDATIGCCMFVGPGEGLKIIT